MLLKSNLLPCKKSKASALTCSFSSIKRPYTSQKPRSKIISLARPTDIDATLRRFIRIATDIVDESSAYIPKVVPRPTAKLIVRAASGLLVYWVLQEALSLVVLVSFVFFLFLYIMSQEEKDGLIRLPPPFSEMAAQFRRFLDGFK